MNSFQTTGFHGQSVQFSPFYDSKLLVGATQKYGFAGTGRVFVLQLNAVPVCLERKIDVPAPLFDAKWSEKNQDVVHIALGNGSILTYHTDNPQSVPVRAWNEHTAEVVNLSTSTVDKELLASASWDGSVKIWSPSFPSSLQTLQGHKGRVHKVAFHYRSVNTLASAGADGSLKVWDIRLRVPTCQIPVNGEATATDWNKYKPDIIYVASTNNTIQGFDVRQPGKSLITLSGHRLAVSSLKTAPHFSDQLATASFDMTACVWNLTSGFQQSVMNKHTEFVRDVDWSLWGDGTFLASTGWDEMVYLWRTSILGNHNTLH
ncbi:peroxin-7 [Schizosaccharomyces japonicus yFS275]|uniref:Peroxin-7 n=1 Tax=Schizosaccharomyces japonicus (strain yFS275 / FY16936) TaxID=402676 RepID=B6JVB9_SCHJY|nr:peroxin-7 [Schizosaccharomyces japonicus yFS275]EEB05320.1 peroxin-7 [Schizosaccharomyces japonicus yFS275]